MIARSARIPWNYSSSAEQRFVDRVVTFLPDLDAVPEQDLIALGRWACDAIDAGHTRYHIQFVARMQLAAEGWSVIAVEVVIDFGMAAFCPAALP